jgi:hypothetical protein
MTTRADSYLHLLEGFKLGSLGVSRKPKVTVEREQNLLPETEKPKIFSHRNVTPTSFLWREWLPQQILAKLPLSPEEQQEALKTSAKPANLNIFLDMIEKWDPKSLWVPLITVNVYGETSDKTLYSVIHEYKQTFENKAKGKVWLKQQIAIIKKKGLAGLNFPQDWKEWAGRS